MQTLLNGMSSAEFVGHIEPKFLSPKNIQSETAAQDQIARDSSERGMPDARNTLSNFRKSTHSQTGYPGAPLRKIAEAVK